MKRARFSDEQILSILREHEAGTPAAELCRRHEIRPATFRRWQTRFGVLEARDANRLKALETENARLRQMLIDVMLDNVGLRELAGKR